MFNSTTTATAGGSVFTGDVRGAIPVFMGGLARSWSVTRTPSGANRWEWRATGPKGSLYGYAHSKAVAEVRAKRAYEELA